MAAAPVWGTSPVLIGDHIETPGNLDCLTATAAMFGWDVGWADAPGVTAALVDGRRPIIALENASGAESLFHYRPPDGPYALVVGNERKGISRRLLRRADRVVQIPAASRQINTLNVASAAAVALYCLSRRRGRIAVRDDPDRRPAVLLAAADPIELGSAVRTAASFGWPQLFVPAADRAWFATDRVTRSLGRGAARRARNPIHVVPLPADAAFDEVCVVSVRGGDAPLQRSDLAGGPRQLVVVADDDPGPAVAQLGRRVTRAHLEVSPGAPCPYRAVASIALAEIARQVGGWPRM